MCASVMVYFIYFKVKAVVFDKTGTLTHGKPEVSRVVLYVAQAICSKSLFLNLVGLAECNSEHPLGQAITKFAKNVNRLTTPIQPSSTFISGVIPLSDSWWLAWSG